METSKLDKYINPVTLGGGTYGTVVKYMRSLLLLYLTPIQIRTPRSTTRWNSQHLIQMRRVSQVQP